MNEKIKTLAKQTLSKDKFGLWLAGDNDITKFTELIVEECVICAEREWIRNGDTEHNRAVSKVIGSIKEHFGAKE